MGSANCFFAVCVSEEAAARGIKGFEPFHTSRAANTLT